MADVSNGSPHQPEVPKVVEKASSDTVGVNIQETGTFAVRLEGELLQMLQDIARQRHMSLSDALSAAITTEHFLREKIQQGNKVLLEQSDRHIYKVDL